MMLAIDALVLVVAIGFAYWVWRSPMQWLEWFVRRPYRGWGLNIVVVDEDKFRRACRRLALLYVGFCIMAVVALWVGKSK